MIIGMETAEIRTKKRCTKCGEVKPLGEFYRKSKARDGHDFRCKVCAKTAVSTWNATNHERHLATCAEYRNANREKVNEWRREQRRRDPEHVRSLEKASYHKHRSAKIDRARAYYQVHRLERLAYQRTRHQANPQPNRERALYWRLNNPERYRASLRRHYAGHVSEYVARARRRNAHIRAIGMLAGNHTEQEWQNLLAKHNGQCVACGTTERISRDHIVPLSKGGNDLIENIQPLCMPCNRRKGNSLPGPIRTG